MGFEVSVTDQEGDLRMVVDNLMKVLTQCAAAMKKANSVLWTTERGIENKMANIFMPY